MMKLDLLTGGDTAVVHSAYLAAVYQADFLLTMKRLILRNQKFGLEAAGFPSLAV